MSVNFFFLSFFQIINLFWFNGQYKISNQEDEEPEKGSQKVLVLLSAWLFDLFISVLLLFFLSVDVRLFLFHVILINVTIEHLVKFYKYEKNVLSILYCVEQSMCSILNGCLICIIICCVLSWYIYLCMCKGILSNVLRAFIFLQLLCFQKAHSWTMNIYNRSMTSDETLSLQLKRKMWP